LLLGPKSKKAAVRRLNEMSVYTVHEPPLHATDAAPDAERFVFVRDGFAIWAFLLAPLWMLWHRMWLVPVGYVVVSMGLEAAMVPLGASRFAEAVVGFLISFLIGLEASTLRRFTLSRRGWKNVGIVSGDDREDAERRFFGAWLRQPRSQHNGPPPMALDASAAPISRPPQSPGVIGLFPEPGAPR
jgi:Protein of unknown function (DUF2628)